MFSPSSIWPSDLRPRVIGEAIIIGRDTVLARRVVDQGLWTLDRPRPAVTARLLSAAYGKPIAEDDWCMQRFDRACLALRGNPTEADRLLRDMPHPEVAAMPELAKAAKLLKDGVAPDRLDRALRNPNLKLPRTPAWAPELALSEDGVVLGDGTIIAPLTDLPGGGCGLGIEGREAEILALLSIARREPAPPAMLTKLTVASQALAAGDPARAAMVLCQSGQPRIDDRELAKGLASAAELMADGMSPAALLKAIGMKPVKWGRETLGKYNPDEPRDNRGRWTDGSADHDGHMIPIETDCYIGPKANRKNENDKAFPYHTLTLSNGSQVMNYKGEPMSEPDGVSLKDNVLWGQSLRRLSPENSALKDDIMASTFAPAVGPMDYQRRMSVDPLINREYVDYGNYNFGAVAAAAGYNLDYALKGGATVNHSSDKSGCYGGNIQSQTMIIKGYADYMQGKIAPLPDDVQPWDQPLNPKAYIKGCKEREEKANKEKNLDIEGEDREERD